MKYFRILFYIFKNNKIYFIPYYLFRGIYYKTYSFFCSNIILNIPFGRKIYYHKNPICSFFTYTYIPDKKEILILRKEILNAKKNLTFIDVGANIGSYSILMSDLINDIIAIEPHPTSFEHCKSNFILNNISEKKVLNCAVGEDNKSIFFTNFEGASTINKKSKSDTGLKVSQKKLDTILDTNPSKKYLVKIDVEGFEEDVIMGMKELFKNDCIEAILFETFNFKIISKLEELDFKVRQLSKHNYYAKKRRVGRKP
ncbi:MAG: FkbM family methyltransferase [Flavobacteriaceae bacterium]